MLLVIFGAGASFDSVPHIPPDRDSVRPIAPFARRLTHDEYRPPLANQLFEDRDSFLHALKAFPQCKPLIPRLRGNPAIEQQLAKFEEQAKTFPDRHKQLAAIRYYIQSVLQHLQTNWQQRHAGVTNYGTFLDEVKRWRTETDEQVIFVTFNYDTMLEDAIEQVFRSQMVELNDYVTHNEFKVVKLHGSINWFHEIQYPIGLANHDAVIDAAPFLRLSPKVTRVQHVPPNAIPFPALAIPVEKKSEFSCPPEHLEVLGNAMREVTKIIAIGWRAMEQDFLKMLSANLTGLKSDVDLMVVSGSADGATGTAANLGMDKPSQCKRSLIDSGFTGLVNNIGLLESFLR
jgi:hypothetical protein